MNPRQRFQKPVIVRLTPILLCLGTLFGFTPEAIPIVISPYGFVQASLSIPAGSYAFVVLNRSGFDNIAVYLERMPGNNVTDVPMRQEFGDTVSTSRARLVRNANLTPGTYRLRVGNRSTWVCAIQVN